jgi:Helix-hairpin-helix motif
MLAGSSSDEPRRPSRVEMLLTGGGQPVDRAAKLTPGRPAQGLRRLLSFVWALLPALSLGYLAPIPIIHAAVKLRTWTLWTASALYTAAAVVWWSATITVSDAPVEPAKLSEPPDWTAALLVGLVVVPTIHAFAIRRRVFEPRSQDPAIVVALQARQRRDQARAIAARDVDLARELRIGRPDLPRQFDDGGLVDVNHAPVSVLMQLLGLPAAAVVNVVEVRDHIGGFSSAEEVIAYTDLSPALVDSVRERLLFLP